MAQFTHSLCEEVISKEGRCSLSPNEITQMARLALRALKDENPWKDQYLKLIHERGEATQNITDEAVVAIDMVRGAPVKYVPADFAYRLENALRSIVRQADFCGWHAGVSATRDSMASMARTATEALRVTSAQEGS